MKIIKSNKTNNIFGRRNSMFGNMEAIEHIYLRKIKVVVA
jgi:hypothetical protein